MTKIKICGLKRIEDIGAVNSFMPEYIGFVFAKSSRRVSIEKALELSKMLDKSIKKVGVFVNENIDIVEKAAQQIPLNVIQLHGDENQEYVDLLRKRTDCEVWKVLRVKDSEVLKKQGEYKVHRFLLDAYAEDEYGGLGKVFNWGILKDAKDRDFILAGGLNINNVERAIKEVEPYAVDISSGVETDGFKDADKIEKIIKIIRG